MKRVLILGSTLLLTTVLSAQQAPTLIKPGEKFDGKVRNLTSENRPDDRKDRPLFAPEEKIHGPQSSDSSVQPCLIVKHKGTLGRRLIWFSLIGVPMAPGAKFDYVDSFNFQDARMAYKAKHLEELSSLGVRIMIMQSNYTAAEIRAARDECRGESTAKP